MLPGTLCSQVGQAMLVIYVSCETLFNGFGILSERKAAALVICEQHRGRVGSLLQGDNCVRFELLGTGTAS